LAPLLIYLVYQGKDHYIWIIICCYLALISDIFDGIIARHYNVATPALRLWDSNVDLVFWLAAIWCMWVGFQHEIEERWVLALPLLLIEWIPDLIYFIRFRKFGCAHNYLSKLFGIFLLINFTLMFGFENSILLTSSMLIGLLSQIDRIFIALILPNHCCDIPSTYHAWLIKKGIPFKKYKLFHS
jgi:CDP-diacylglycerol--glycerol-3-phosphate 3-phosphatidyltransferase